MHCLYRGKMLHQRWTGKNALDAVLVKQLALPNPFRQSAVKSSKAADLGQGIS